MRALEIRWIQAKHRKTFFVLGSYGFLVVWRIIIDHKDAETFLSRTF